MTELSPRPAQPRLRLLLGLILLSAVSAAGCAAPYGVHSASPEEIHRALTGSVLSTGQLSGFSEIALRRHNLVSQFADDPTNALEALRQHLIGGDDEPDTLFALSELWFYHAVHNIERAKNPASKLAARTRAERRPAFLASALYAYAYLFPADKSKAPDPFDSRSRTACDLYNRAITEAFKSDDGKRVDLAAGTFPLPFGTIAIEFDEAQRRWADRRLVDFVPAGEIAVDGFRNRYRQPGIGAPLAARTKATDGGDVSSAFVGPRVRVPTTAILRLDYPRRQLAGSNLQGRLELHSSTDERNVQLGDYSVPLEMEPTAALAQMFSESRPWEVELRLFLGSLLALEKPQRLLAREPYRRGRIPVVFVHGTASSVARWADMVNDLDADPWIRERYQFWFYTYDSGNPIAYSAMRLREALKKAVHDFDPNGSDDCLQQMVVIGHSQGGLLTKMTAIDSGDRFWRNLSDTPLDQLNVSEETRALLREGMFVTPLPFVRRLVFVATPQRGSYLAGPDLVRRLAQRLVAMPATLLQVSSDLLMRDDVRPYLKMEALPTSIDNMSPGHPFIRTISQIPVAPGIPAHSIIGVVGNGPKEDGGDGVVKYASAHVEGVESELIVDSPHSMQSHPDVINEVQRILHLHGETNVCGR